MDGLAAAVPVGVLCAAARDPQPWPQPLLMAVPAGAAWLVVGVVRNRYRRGEPAGTGAVLPVLCDWLTMLGVLAVACVAARIEVALADCVVALVPCLAVAVVRRTLVHRCLMAARRRARALRRVLVVGEAGAVDLVLARLTRRTDHEYVVIGSCLVGEEPGGAALPVPGRLACDGDAPEGAARDGETVLRCAAALDADLVLVVPGRRLTAGRVRRVAWALHDHGLDLAVLPGLVDVAEHRVRLAEAAGLTVLHIAPAARRGLPVLWKGVTDRLGALLLLVLLSPVFVMVAAAIRLSTGGPVFYWQIRVGRELMPFRMWKFRTMVVTADRMRAALESVNEQDGAMFKIRRDPRVTRVGRVLRRFSLDELPQLFNVLAGHMSLVGPRPPLPEEVERYDGTELRRLSVKPGLTGLWQVSGRSELSWDETVALDLSYVDNWSYARDIGLLARTVRAVVDGRGAY
ncbi:putative glycosyltransferase [Streptomyces sp. NBRC 110611]|uniref:exopolysaccharide biosynthesis polyprenyl glycosylphosphotransferase n=1 Tax=Streptomyces sp. NBRC 110611 TaxID=1621259 RepID=UPI00082A60B4|nr:exopolysaccharide biosynthesis polyprenyl glycosylphosphotransferase [Streptomyces sp. NBRC 110611]GAU69266.1 putative glycosyltransferase [Streptomyces sp. NBRC 110611]